MNVLLINGSPHQNGSTYTALAEVEKQLHANGITTSWYHLGKGAYYGCAACGGCKKTGDCVYDDGTNQCKEQLRAADGVVVGSPVYYAGVNGALCAMLDRLFFSAGGDAFAGKPAAAVVACRRGGSTAALDRLSKYFLYGKMPMVSSQYWNMVHGTNAEEVKKDEEGMQTMRVLGSQMAWMLKALKAAGAPPVLDEPRAKTSFIR